MANINEKFLHRENGQLSGFALDSMSGWGTLPYMSPERFTKYRTSMSADVYSLGIVFYEIATGDLPYDRRRSITEQIVSGESFWLAAATMKSCPEKISDLVLAMIHPDQDKRICDYKHIIKVIQKL